MLLAVFMTYLVRHLTSRTNLSLSRPQHRGDSAFWAASDASAAVMDVEAQDQLLDEADINARLARGELRSTDLVRVGRGWMSLTDFEPAATEASRAAARENRRRNLKYAGYLLLMAAFFVLRLWIRTR